MPKDYYTGILEKAIVRSELSEDPVSKPIILECGMGNGYTFEPNSNFLFSTYSYPAKTLGTVTIDTKNLCQPKVKIEFSCNIHLTETNKGIVQMEFQLVRSSNTCAELPLSYWYFKLQVGNNNLAQPFSFIYCDCNTNPDAYDYYVKCQPIELDVASICINNCHMAALAQSCCD